MDLTQKDSLTAYQQFKVEFDKQIIANEKSIAELKASFADANKENKAFMKRNWPDWKKETAK